MDSTGTPNLGFAPGVTQGTLGTVTGVLLPCVQNIFGIMLFIRFSWIVGSAGWLQVMKMVDMTIYIPISKYIPYYYYLQYFCQF